MRTRDQKVLWRLSREPAYVAEIIRDTEVGPHGVAEAVRALQTRGYATRVEGDPGQWTITADGREALRAERSWMERTVCPACLRIRGPIHWVVRLAGFCDGAQPAPAPAPPPAPRVYVVGTARSADYFIRWTGEPPNRFRLITRKEQLQGLAHGIDVVLIHEPGLDRREIIQYLNVIQARVRWINLDQLP